MSFNQQGNNYQSGNTNSGTETFRATGHGVQGAGANDGGDMNNSLSRDSRSGNPDSTNQRLTQDERTENQSGGLNRGYGNSNTGNSGREGDSDNFGNQSASERRSGGGQQQNIPSSQDAPDTGYMSTSGMNNNSGMGTAGSRSNQGLDSTGSQTTDRDFGGGDNNVPGFSDPPKVDQDTMKAVSMDQQRGRGLGGDSSAGQYDVFTGRNSGIGADDNARRSDMAGSGQSGRAGENLDSQVYTGSDKAATGTGNRGRELGDQPEVKPSLTDKVVGGMQKAAGKMTANQGLKEKGQDRAMGDAATARKN